MKRNELRLIEAYRGGSHRVFHVVNTGQHVKRNSDTLEFFDTEKCWHNDKNPCPAILQIRKET